jgi:hypothetical protein
MNVWKVLTFWVITLNLRERAGKMSQIFQQVEIGEVDLKNNSDFMTSSECSTSDIKDKK